ncbi:MAG TPA: hypothetical protein VFN67_23985 [Polyangiales bacterium]|nr:hypothetical protein [Polyangiales bacterium]
MKKSDPNAYAELGTTWFSLMSNMSQAAHALASCSNISAQTACYWGTDSYNNGGRQPQNAAFRGFQIPQMMQDLYGNPALTPEVIAKVFGSNADAVYGIDPKVLRQKIKQDAIDNVLTRRFPSRPRPHGPRTRREYMSFLRWSGIA